MGAVALKSCFACSLFFSACVCCRRFPEAGMSYPPIRVDQPKTWPLKTVLAEASRDYDRVVTTDVAIRADGATMLVHFNTGGFAADVRLENRSGREIHYRQSGSSDTYRVLSPSFHVLYTRDQVVGPETLEWMVKDCAKTVEQPFGQFGMRISKPGGSPLCTVTFPDGPQKVILFCDAAIAASIAKSTGVGSSRSEDGKRQQVPSLSSGVDTHFTLVLRSVCLSLLAPGPLEVATLSLQDKIGWEFMLPRSDGWGEDWMRFGQGDQCKLEVAFQNRSQQVIKVDHDKHVNITDMSLVLGNGVTTVVRRHHHPAVRMTYVDSSENTIVRLVLEHMQIDNQLPDPFVPVVLVPAVPSRSSQPQLPLLKVLMIIGKSENKSAALMVERCSVLLQKITVSVTERFLLRLADLTPGSASFEPVETVKVSLDVEEALKPLYSSEERSSMVASSMVSPVCLHR